MTKTINSMTAEDRIYPSDNEFEIPTLRLDMMPQSGLLLPFSHWGMSSRLKTDVATFGFYVDDYRFDNVWLHPERIIDSGCEEIIEVNFSVFPTTPIAAGLNQIYKKRWISRYLQENGIRVWADLNVPSKFYDFNRLGIPDGYNAFATRGCADFLESLFGEYELAKDISGKDVPNMIVYGGGKRVQEFCRQKDLLYVEQIFASKRKEVGNVE